MNWLLYITTIWSFEILDLRKLYDQNMKMSFAAVIDSGSTGTRLNIYGFDSNKMLRLYYIDILEPGLSATPISDIRYSLKYLFDESNKNLKDFNFDIKNARMAFNATAGLRLLPEYLSNAIMAEVKNVLSEYKASADNIKIISGSEEGILAIKSLLLQKGFEKDAIRIHGCQFLEQIKELDINHGYCNEIEQNLDVDHTLGVIDMGGGSVQVAYLDDANHRLVSQSFLGYGLNESMKEIKSHPNYLECKKSNTKELSVCRSIFRDLFLNGPSSERSDGISQVDEIFLISYFYDKFFTAGEHYKKSLKDVKEDFEKKCTTLEDESCLEVHFLVMLLKHFKFKDETSFFLVNKILGINLNWSIAKAFSLIEEAGYFDKQPLTEE